MPEWLPLCAFYGAGNLPPMPGKPIAIIAEHDIGGLVLGWPLNMDGSQGRLVILCAILPMLFCAFMILLSAFRMKDYRQRL